MEEVCVTKAIKQIAEATHNRIATLEDSVTEIAIAVGRSAAKISEIHGKVSSGGSTPSKAELSPSQFEIISQMRTQLSANSALLNEALKSPSEFGTPVRDGFGQVGPTAPLKKCQDC